MSSLPFYSSIFDLQQVAPNGISFLCVSHISRTISSLFGTARFAFKALPSHLPDDRSKPYSFFFFFSFLHVGMCNYQPIEVVVAVRSQFSLFLLGFQRFEFSNLMIRFE
ncbi:hypothetical protein B9Z55_015960 [Caenorhabditis nigoni]|uniref:Uncharacterized protein n=1 Tax=Caenorhabditis nigoni TaxID=1611254 RepID=A0A2G5UDF4_9PELO|nr:hypothetical protein B9Z55_015960 [Caenorhabditis nigoni]